MGSTCSARLSVSGFNAGGDWCGSPATNIILPASESERATKGSSIKYIQHLRTSGAVMSSSSFLVDRLVRGVDFSTATAIAEFGIGNGCVTRELLRRMRPDARLISLEINPAFVEDGRKIRDARLTVRQACATTLPTVLEEEGVESVDAVVSSLPLAIMNDDVVDRLLEAVHQSLVPEGRFIQYQYGLSQRRRLSRRFDDVEVGFTLFNMPPAFVYGCTRQATG